MSIVETQFWHRLNNMPDAVFPEKHLNIFPEQQQITHKNKLIIFAFVL